MYGCPGDVHAGNRPAGNHLGEDGEDKMKNANISQCANPECMQEFTRLGEGKLFVRPGGRGDKGLKQKALWLCQNCAEQFDLRFDRREQEYHMVRRRSVA